MALCFKQAPLGAVFLAEFPLDWHRLGDSSATPSSSAGACPLDVPETEDAYQITTDAPGLDKSEIKIEVRKNRLTLEGSQQEEKREDKEDITRCERSRRSFRRVLRLPKNADADNVQAALDKGVLTLTIPKKKEEEEDENVRTINID